MPTKQETALDERIIGATVAALEMFSIHLGRRLGLYEALDEPRTVSDVCAETGIAERYAREWLEQQAVAGLIDVDDPPVPWDRRSYHLNSSQRALFTEPDHPSHVSPLADMLAGIGGVLDSLAEAYSTGGGVPYADYEASFRFGQGGINRPASTNDLVESWLRDIPDVVDRLRAGGRIADFGCGTGWSTISLARGFPHATVVGYDNDAASIADAIDNAATAGVAAEFQCADAAEAGQHGPFDLIVIVETLHDLADPIGALSAARAALQPDGAVVIADEKVADTFTAPGDELERMMYGWSVLHCLPASLSDADSAAIGTVLRPAMAGLMAEEAGFTSFLRSEIDAGFFNLYVLRP